MTNETSDVEDVSRLEETIRQQRRILASRGVDERIPIRLRAPGRPFVSPLVAILIIVAIVGVVAAVIVISQSFPAIPPSVFHANCSGLSSSIATVPVGGSGDVEFNCGSAAFSVGAPGGTATPAFALPGGYVDVWVFPSSNLLESTCALTSGGTNITSKGTTTLGAGTYNYCLDYANVPAIGLAAFVLTWSQ
ncbi:MAG TPA: hypothetical protein VEO96_00570 [Thermoplasmata archaeon]|nr:hypothetical protein [Thermoplasmata archaeon]